MKEINKTLKGSKHGEIAKIIPKMENLNKIYKVHKIQIKQNN